MTNASREPALAAQACLPGQQHPSVRNATSSFFHRWRLLLMLFLVAVVLNVFVAWSCVLWSPYRSHTAPSSEKLANGYPATIPGPFGQQGWWFTNAGVGVWQSIPAGARGVNEQFLYWRGSTTPAYYRGGWPMLSMGSTVTCHNDLARWDLPASEILRRGVQTSWFPAWLHVREERRLPLLPLCYGFAINTALYFCALASAWLLVRRYCVGPRT
jgi:hypothetical protein